MPMTGLLALYFQTAGNTTPYAGRVSPAETTGIVSPVETRGVVNPIATEGDA